MVGKREQQKAEACTLTLSTCHHLCYGRDASRGYHYFGIPSPYPSGQLVIANAQEKYVNDSSSFRSSIFAVSLASQKWGKSQEGEAQESPKYSYLSTENHKLRTVEVIQDLESI